MSFPGLVFLFVGISTLSISAGLLIAATDSELNGLELALSTAKQNYILGEPVSLGVKVANNSNSHVKLPGAMDVYAGTLLVFVAFENGPYRQYRGPGWSMIGVQAIKPPVLDAGGSIETTATILHNRAPQRGTLNEQSWKLITERDIDTEIALPKPGRYRIKAVLFGKVESMPVEIYLSEPQKIDDLEIWKIINKEPEYAFFMQSGDLLRGTLTGQKNKEFIDDIENFVKYYAASTYTRYFRAALVKYRGAVERYQKATKVR